MQQKIIIILLLFLIVTGCAKTDSSSKKDEQKIPKIPILKNDEIKDDAGIKEIKDNVFIQFTDDMYVNPEDYGNKKLKIEGIMYIDSYENEEELHYFIARRTPGCCGNDGLAGLEIYYDGEIPEKDSWVIGKGIWKKSSISSSGWILALYSLENGPKGDEFLEYNY